MGCPSFTELKFGPISKDALNTIGKKKEIGDMLIKSIGYGTLVNLFAGNGVIKASYSISQTDFAAMTGAMRAAPNILRSVVRTIALQTHDKVNTHAERVFWKAVFQGCEI